jgi:hypothetical protein
VKIRKQILYDGAKERVRRLKLGSLLDEVRKIIRTTKVRLEERKHANSGGALRRLLDKGFERRKGWTRKTSGASDWKKCQEIDGARVCVEVEIQVSARSDLVVIDIYHLRRSIQDGDIDLGILVVPSDRLSQFLKSRQPSLRETERAVEETDAHRLPLVVLAVEHDGPGPALKGSEGQ